jgi:hypothetical protein
MTTFNTINANHSKYNTESEYKFNKNVPLTSDRIPKGICVIDDFGRSRGLRRGMTMEDLRFADGTTHNILHFTFFVKIKLRGSGRAEA